MAFAPKMKTENSKDVTERTEPTDAPLDLSCHNRKRESGESVTTSPTKLKIISKHAVIYDEFEQSERINTLENRSNERTSSSKKINSTPKQLMQTQEQKLIDINSIPTEKSFKPLVFTAPEITASSTRPTPGDCHKHTHVRHLPPNSRAQDGHYRQNSSSPHSNAGVFSQPLRCQPKINNFHFSLLKLLEHQKETECGERSSCAVSSTGSLLQQMSFQNLHLSFPYLYKSTCFPDIVSYLAPFLKPDPANSRKNLVSAVGPMCSSTENFRKSSLATNCSYQNGRKTPLFQKTAASKENPENERNVLLHSEVFDLFNENLEASHESRLRSLRIPGKEKTESVSNGNFSEFQLCKNPSGGFPNSSYSRSKPGIPRPVSFKPCQITCTRCGRTYATEGALAKHMKMHEHPEEVNSFKCKICKKTCSTLGALRMHIRTHTLPCVCHICGKAFSRTWLLQGHIRTHTGEKPYQCSKCSRAFADRSNLRAHMQTHELIKRYSCNGCDKTFSRISLLKRHQRHCSANIACESGEPQQLESKISDVFNQKNGNRTVTSV